MKDRNDVMVGDAAKFEAWWKRAAARHAGVQLAVAHVEGAVPDPVEELVFALLLWNTTTPLARAAHAALRREFVDLNELRVASPADIVDVIGAHYPDGLERAIRLRQALGDIFATHSCLSLPRIDGRQDGVAMLRELQGVPYGCAARVALTCWDAAVVPIDDAVVRVLVSARVLKTGVPHEDVAAWLLSRVKPVPAATCAAILQACVDDPKHAPAAKPTLVQPADAKASTRKVGRSSPAKDAAGKPTPTAKARAKGSP